ncbi:hypothetical protein CKO13_08735 [Halorhodospira neutriphila]|uniref:Uncharacterized protein n=1 Tax=Halorhodospira neutriphila TaxID=168379 RepID=A0ABS1EAK3_9GAMM|nr:hypothetical protein [Halorhodospira neutriphila]
MRCAESAEPTQSQERAGPEAFPVTYRLLASCASKPVTTIQSRAAADPSFPRPAGRRRPSPTGRPELLFDPHKVRAWLAREVERGRLDPAVLGRFDWLWRHAGLLRG